LKPLFTVHAGEFLVGCEIEKLFKNVKVWIPAKDTGIDLLASNKANTKTLSLQVKLSRDYIYTDEKNHEIRGELRAGGWYKLARKKIQNSDAKYWVFVLFGSKDQSKDFLIIKPKDLLTRLNKIHGKVKIFHIYFWVTNHDKCYEARKLGKSKGRLQIARQEFIEKKYDFTTYLMKLKDWAPLMVLNG
jgi:hypothetical protein